MIGCPCLTPPLLMLAFIKIKTTYPIKPFAYNTSTLVQGLHAAMTSHSVQCLLARGIFNTSVGEEN